MLRNRAVVIAQPDITFNGGFLRTLQVARMAAEVGADITPHAPQPGYLRAVLAQFAAAVPNLGRFQEYGAVPATWPSFLSPAVEVKNGVITLPAGPGMGITVDPSYVAKAALV
jgi:L-alanine-DL-glutamate epimerase-like enolase superfamily enzyme